MNQRTKHSMLHIRGKIRFNKRKEKKRKGKKKKKKKGVTMATRLQIRHLGQQASNTWGCYSKTCEHKIAHEPFN